MQELLQNPMVQAGIAPLVVALAVALALWRTRHAWVAAIAAYAVAMALSSGISFSPLTAGRKVMLLVLLSPLLGAALDRLDAARLRALPAVLGALGGLATLWVFASLLGQRAGAERWLAGAGLVAFVGAFVHLSLRLREHGAAGGAHGIAAGLGVGVAALLSASVGYLTGGVALAAGAGAVVLLQFVFNHAAAPGYTGMLPLALAPALFATATVMLAQLPWYALPLLALVPVVASWAAGRAQAVRARLVVACTAAASAALPFVLVAWNATRASSSVVS